MLHNIIYRVIHLVHESFSRGDKYRFWKINKYECCYHIFFIFIIFFKFFNPFLNNYNLPFLFHIRKPNIIILNILIYQTIIYNRYLKFLTRGVIYNIHIVDQHFPGYTSTLRLSILATCA